MYGGEERCIHGFGGNLREKDNFQVPSVDGRIIIRWIFRKWDVRAWTGLIWLKIRTVGGQL